MLWLAAGGLLGAAAIGTGAAAALLFSKTVPRPKGTDQDIQEEFADAKKMAAYAEKMAPIGEWAEEQEFTDLYTMSSDGLRLHALYLPTEDPINKLVIIHHGFTSNARGGVPHTKFFHELGYGVLLLDLRAHGESEGKYVGFGILERFDTLAWLKEVDERFGRDVKVVLHGTSIGAGTALMALGLTEVQERVSAVIADCGFTSPAEILSHVMRKNYRILITKPIIQLNDVYTKAVAGYRFDEYSTLTALKDNRVPVLFIHGEQDKFVPTWMSEKNYEACSAKKQLLMVEDAGHGSSVFENQELYERTEREFLGEIGL